MAMQVRSIEAVRGVGRSPVDLAGRSGGKLVVKRLRATIAPHLSRAAFARVVDELERYGFPEADPLFKGRYAPAVRAWLDTREGLNKTGSQVQDGQETLDDGGAK